MKRAYVPAVLAVVILAATMCWQSVLPKTILCDPPNRHLGELAGYTSERLEPGEVELKALPGDTVFEKRVYTAADGSQFLATMVIGGSTRASIHRPELCLPSQGYLMTAPRTRTVAGTDWRLITLGGGAGRPSAGFAYTFFNQAGFRTASHIQRIFRDVWDRSFYGRIDRWSMVTVFASTTDEKVLTAFLAKLKEVVE